MELRKHLDEAIRLIAPYYTAASFWAIFGKVDEDMAYSAAKGHFEAGEFIEGVDALHRDSPDTNPFCCPPVWESIKKGLANVLSMMRTFRQDDTLFATFLLYTEQLTGKRQRALDLIVTEQEKVSAAEPLVSFLRSETYGEELLREAKDAVDAFARAGQMRDLADVYLWRKPEQLLAVLTVYQEKLPDEHGPVRMPLSDIFMRASLLILACREETLPPPGTTTHAGNTEQEADVRRISSIIETLPGAISPGMLGGESAGGPPESPAQKLESIRNWTRSFEANENQMYGEIVGKAALHVRQFRDLYVLSATLLRLFRGVQEQHRTSQSLLEQLDQIQDPDERSRITQKIFDTLSPESIMQAFRQN